jgi:hypothetical protein
MAKLTPGALINGASGAQGTIVFSRNRGGFYSRARVTPTNPSSTLQVSYRASFKAASQRWSSTLTDAQRLAWKSFAENMNNISTLGRRAPQTAFNAFVLVNYYDQILNGDFLDDPPSSPKYPQLTALSASGSVSGTSLSLTWTATTMNGATGLLVRATQPLSAGRLQPSGTWAYVTEKLTNATQPYNAWTEYVAHHATPTAGQKTFLQAMVFDFNTFIPSVYQRTGFAWSA